MNKQSSLHSALWDRLASRPDQIPHALLLIGPSGVGKRLFAGDLAQALLCESAGNELHYCGECQSCRWFASQAHPDFRRVSPESDQEEDDEGAGEKKRASSQIKIDQIRALDDFVYVGSHREKGRVVLIEPAEAMNSAAANSLLKLLEEPPATVYFILVSSSWRRLLPTIRSRCRTLSFSRPSMDVSLRWLEERGHRSAREFLAFAGGAPLQAILEGERGSQVSTLLDSLAHPGNDPLVLAGRWEGQVGKDGKLTMEDLLTVLQKWLSDLSRAKLGVPIRYVADRGEAVPGLIEKASATNLIRCYNDLTKVRAMASHPLNPRLFLEETAERYLRALATARR